MILTKRFFLFFIILLFTFQKSFSENTDLYKKIDLFGEVLEKISKEYVDEVVNETLENCQIVYTAE